MQKIKKLRSILLTFALVFVASLIVAPNQLTYAAAGKPKVSVTGLSTTYNLDQQPGVLKAISTGTTKYVQYKIVLTKTSTNKTTVLTRGYTSKVSPSKAYTFKLPTLTYGQYKIRVYVRTYGSKASYESVYSKYIYMYNSINLTKKGQVYGGNTAIVRDNVYVNADNVTLNNIKVKNTLYLNPGKNGSATLNNVQAANIQVLSGGTSSIHFNNVKVSMRLTVATTGNLPVRIETKGTTQVALTNIRSSAILQVVAGTFGNVFVNKNASNGASVLELRGTFDKPVTVYAPVTLKAAAEAVVPSVVVAPIESTSKIVLDGNFEAVQVDKAAKLEVTSGTIDNIVAKANLDITVDEGAAVTDVQSNGNDVNVNGDGKVDTNVDGQPVVSQLQQYVESKLTNSNISLINVLLSSKGYSLSNFNTTTKSIDITVTDKSETIGSIYSKIKTGNNATDLLAIFASYLDLNNAITNWSTLKTAAVDRLTAKGYTDAANDLKTNGFISFALNQTPDTIDDMKAKLTAEDRSFDNIPKITIKGADLTAVTVKDSSNAALLNLTNLNSGTASLDIDSIKNSLGINKPLKDVTVSELKSASISFTFSNGETYTINIK